MNLPERGPSQVRIGIAIEIPEPFGPALQEARAAFGDPFAGDIPPHITLLGRSEERRVGKECPV